MARIFSNQQNNMSFECPQIRAPRCFSGPPPLMQSNSRFFFCFAIPNWDRSNKKKNPRPAPSDVRFPKANKTNPARSPLYLLNSPRSPSLATAPPTPTTNPSTLHRDAIKSGRSASPNDCRHLECALHSCVQRH